MALNALTNNRFILKVSKQFIYSFHKSIVIKNRISGGRLREPENQCLV